MTIERLERLLTRKEITREVGISRSTIYRLLRNGSFPQPIRIGERGIRWPESQVQAWIAERKAAIQPRDEFASTDP